MRLCIDWGNTLVKAALFNDQHKITAQASWQPEEAAAGIKELAARATPVAAILCSVSDKSAEAEAFLKGTAKYLKLDGNTRLPIMNAYHSPETLGADRLAMAVAANAEYPDKNNLVIGIGTCIPSTLAKTRCS